MLRMLWRLGLCLTLGCLPLRAIAQPSAGQLAAGNELSAAGERAYAAGRYAEALENFAQAHQRLQKPALLYRMGESAEKAGMFDRAVTAFEAYLGTVSDARGRAAVEKRIEADRRAQQRGSLSPEVAARSAADSDASGDATLQPAASPGKDGNVARAWWLWAGAGALAVAGIVVVAVLVGPSSSHEARPAQGNVGGVVLTLEGR